MKPLTEEFGARCLKLHSGALGLRGGMRFDAKAVEGMPAVMDFIGSDNSIDRYGEVVQQDGWQLDNFRANPVIPDCHCYDSISRILGRALTVEVKAGKLVNRVEFCLDNPLGELAFKMAKGGFIRSQSVGFIPLEWKNGAQTGDPERTYLKQELLEISLVVVPANPQATVSMKSALASGAVTGSDLRACADYFKKLCSDDSTAGTPTASGASGGVTNDARLERLRMARALNEVLKLA
jgi:HK97 family phage prohead protease